MSGAVRKGGTFGPALTRARERYGFPSAWQFYHRNGGRRFFAFSYQYYLRIERGSALPRPQWLLSIFEGLREHFDMKECRSLTLSYLEDMLGKEQFSRFLEPLICTHGTKPHPAISVMQRWRRQEASYHLTSEQYEAVTSNEAAYCCFELLSNDRGAWTAGDLAHELDFPREAVSRGLKTMVAQGPGQGSLEGTLPQLACRKVILVSFCDQAERGAPPP